MKWKFNKKILGMPIVMSSAFLLVSCTQNVEDKNNPRKHVDKIKNQFLERSRTKLNQFYPIDWKINDELDIDQLGIERPFLSGQINVTYYVKKVHLDVGIVEIKIKFLYNFQHVDSKDIIVYGFKNHNTIDRDIDKVLEQIASEYQIVNNHLASEVRLEIEDFLDLKKIKLNGVSLSINNIKSDNERGQIEVEIKAKKWARFKTKIIFVKGFRTSDEKIDETINHVLSQISSEQIIEVDSLPSHFEGQLKSLLNLQNIDLNNTEISVEDISRHDDEGVIKANMHIQKFDRANSKIITFKGFKTITKLFEEIRQHTGSFTKENAFDLKAMSFDIKKEKWQVLLEKFIDHSTAKFESRVFNMIKWEINNYDKKIWDVRNLHLVFSTLIKFELRTNQALLKSEWIEVNFNNIKLDQAELNIYIEKTQLEKYLQKKIKSKFFDEKIAETLKASFDKMILTGQKIEEEFGIEFEEATKNNVEIFGKIDGIFKDKDGAATNTTIIAISLTINQNELSVVIESPLWIIFKN